MHEVNILWDGVKELLIILKLLMNIVIIVKKNVILL